MTGDPRVLRQDVRDFTVQIRHSTADEVIVGTGIVVSRSGIVVTCAHVLYAAGVDPRALGAGPEPGAETVRVYLPRRAGRPAELRTATVAASFTETDDDIVCLQIDGTLPLPSDRVAVVGTAESSRWHPFESYGYRRLAKYVAGLARGTILGEVEPPEEYELLADPIQVESSQINSGMSGSALLDLERNLVVGIVSETWTQEPDGKDRDTAWAVNTSVLRFADVDVDIRRDPLPLRRVQHPIVDSSFTAATMPVPGNRMGGAPSTLSEWVGRDSLQQILGREWHNPNRLVVGLIGFGGEGKTSLARRWVDRLLTAGPGPDSPVGVFWWSFVDRDSADEFLDAAVEFMSSGRISSEEIAERGSRAAFAASLLRVGRYLIILDGMEVMQYQTGDQYGSITSPELREFLNYVATPGHQSFCVITSRAPVLDLMPYVTYRHVDVLPLRTSAGVRLLRNLGVLGTDAALEQVVRDWAGHALTLSLLAAYLVRKHNGDVRRVNRIPPPDPGLTRDEMVRRVLIEYDECLSVAERTFLTRFSVFRRAVADAGLSTVARGMNQATDTNGDDAHRPEEDSLRSVLTHLVVARILRSDEAGRMGMHPLIRDYYVRRGEQDPEAWRRLHTEAKKYYLDSVAAMPEHPALEDLAPAIEAVHHACGSGVYDEACDLLNDQLYQRDRGLITRELNAYEATLSVLLDFFPQQEVHGDPLVTDSESRGWVLHETATCLQLLGRLRESAAVARRAMQEFKDGAKWHEAAVTCQNMAELYLSLGALPGCAALVRETFTLAELACDREDELVAETLRGALAHFEGRPDEAETAFDKALQLARDFTPIPALYSSSGIRYAEHLRRSGRHEQALSVTQTNLRVCRSAGWRADEGLCQVALGDLALDAGDAGTAINAYDEAIRIAHSITRRDVFIQALLGHARWANHTGRSDTALADLEQGLSLAALGGYRLAEIDARIALAEAHRAGGATDTAWAEGTQAEQMSIEIGYRLGQVHARSIMGQIRAR
ncbi:MULTISPECIES: tetratricopeptide repeat-containing serine protease family protein [unclassified Frankia]|uniref:tetratricopeptide repeat-containing serine protease family protein n=1 Tax=unclassified Frankia TaxID=2632575 RepID=UPI002AD248B1|nr:MULTISPECIES: tetratricopeptide repeat-containing serine protease family protein [unclassified Frankia]